MKYILLVSILVFTHNPLATAAAPQKTAVAAPVIAKSYLANGEGEVEFLALGRPAMMKIKGKGKAPEGELKMVGKDQIAGVLTAKLETLDTEMSLRNEHMKEKYLQTKLYPDAVITLEPITIPELSSAVDFSKENIPFRGKLKLHGEEKEVAGEANISRAGDKIIVQAGFPLKTSDFKIDTPKHMGITVAEEVKVSVNVSATEQKL